MVAAVMRYTYSPLTNFWSSLTRTVEIIGYSRAAAELARLGYQEEAKNCMMMIKKIKSAKQ